MAHLFMLRRGLAKYSSVLGSASTKKLESTKFSNNAVDIAPKMAHLFMFRRGLAKYSSVHGAASKIKKVESTKFLNNAVGTFAENVLKRDQKVNGMASGLQSPMIPGNTSTITLDTDNLSASKRSFNQGIKKAQAWCCANGIHYDLSNYLGPGSQVYTTPGKGTFHLTFEIKKPELPEPKRGPTIFINARDLYFKGWTGKHGTFETQEFRQTYDYIKGQPCKILKTGDNYRQLIGARLQDVRVGPFPMVEAAEVLDKCEGLITSDLLTSIGVFGVNICEAIRLQDVQDEVEEAFEDFHIVTLHSRRENLEPQIRTYAHYSRQMLQCIDCIVRGKAIPEIVIRRGLDYKSVEELLAKISVPKIDRYREGIFEQEPEETPVWYPPYPDVLGDADTGSNED